MGRFTNTEATNREAELRRACDRRNSAGPQGASFVKMGVGCRDRHPGPARATAAAYPGRTGPSSPTTRLHAVTEHKLKE